MYACVQVNVCMRADEFSGRSFSYFPLACCTKIHQIIKPRFRVTNSSWTKFQIVVRDIRNHVFSVWRILDWGCSVLMETVINRMILLSWASYDEKGPIQRGLLCKRKQITQYQITWLQKRLEGTFQGFCSRGLTTMSTESQNSTFKFLCKRNEFKYVNEMKRNEYQWV